MSLEHDLANLPRPAPPPDLAAVVMARIARIEETAPLQSNAPVPGAWPAWVTAVGALAAAVLVVSSPKLGVMSSFVLATSLVIYLVGLFGMVSDRRT